jgi:hypothetical protein
VHAAAVGCSVYSRRVDTRSLIANNLRRGVAKTLAVLWPPNAAVVARNAVDVVGLKRGRKPSAQVALDAAVDDALSWLSRSQDAVGDGGVGSFEFYGWTTGYPEVTGYVIPTFWDYHHLLTRRELADRAVRMADWEIRIQQPGGGWEGGTLGSGLPPLVFNTGQVLRGLIRTHIETGEPRYLESAVRGADWIVASQDPDGSWTRANHEGMKRTYDSYVSAPLARLGQLIGQDAYVEAARRNCEFVLSQQRHNGWYANCDNSRYFNDAPSTHVLCYTADGLLETGRLLAEHAFVAGGASTVAALSERVERSGFLPGRFDRDWNAKVTWDCLTGSAQLGILLMRLSEDREHAEYEATAHRLVDFLAHVQRLNSIGENRRGGLAGSYPIWGLYAPFKYPCWATKYFLDLCCLIETRAQSRSTCERGSPDGPADERGRDAP